MMDEARPPGMTRRQAIGAMAALALPIHPPFAADLSLVTDPEAPILPVQEEAFAWLKRWL